MTAKVLSNLTFGDSLQAALGLESDTSLLAPAVSGLTFYLKYFLSLIRIFLSEAKYLNVNPVSL